MFRVRIEMMQRVVFYELFWPTEGSGLRSLGPRAMKFRIRRGAQSMSSEDTGDCGALDFVAQYSNGPFKRSPVRDKRSKKEAADFPL
jgi:hypothetical protein